MVHTGAIDAGRAPAVREAVAFQADREVPVARTLLRRASSRLARYLLRAPRRLRSDRPLISFTFDDAPRSAFTTGAPILESAGGRGVFYIASGLIETAYPCYELVRPADIRDLRRRGHEIALHGFRHAPVTELSAEALRADIARNRADLEAIEPGLGSPNFAYPFGQLALGAKSTLSGLVGSSRGIVPGVNGDGFDAQNLRSVELADARLSRAQMADWLNRAARLRGWLIFTLHDVADRPSPYGCTPTFLRSALEGAAARGFEIVTVGQALARTAAK